MIEALRTLRRRVTYWLCGKFGWDVQEDDFR